MVDKPGADLHPFKTTTIIPPAPVEQVSVFNEGPEAIPAIRHQIEAIDFGIIRLLIERAKLSYRIQQIRIAEGGVRTETGQEKTVLNRYAGLGRMGHEIGNAVLHFCKGGTR